jgi:hypothetical protein
MSIFGARAGHESWPQPLHPARLQPAPRGNLGAGPTLIGPESADHGVGPPLKWGHKSPIKPPSPSLHCDRPPHRLGDGRPGDLRRHRRHAPRLHRYSATTTGPAWSASSRCQLPQILAPISAGILTCSPRGLAGARTRALVCALDGALQPEIPEWRPLLVVAGAKRPEPDLKLLPRRPCRHGHHAEARVRVDTSRMSRMIR